MDKKLKIIAEIFLILGAGLFIVFISAGFWGHDYFGLKEISARYAKYKAIAVCVAFIFPGFILLKISEFIKNKKNKNE